jgi:hypothetical protein
LLLFGPVAPFPYIAALLVVAIAEPTNHQVVSIRPAFMLWGIKKAQASREWEGVGAEETASVFPFARSEGPKSSFIDEEGIDAVEAKGKKKAIFVKESFTCETKNDMMPKNFEISKNILTLGKHLTLRSNYCSRC